MFEIDFLPIENEEGPSPKSGDAIALRFSVPTQVDPVVIVVDAGFSATGESMVEHVRKYYGTSRVDLLVSTHPDTDHLNGVATVVENLDVQELLIHRPDLHVASGIKDFGNLDTIEKVVDVARARGTVITEPFAGLVRFGAAVRVLGPTAEYYEELVEQHLAEARSGEADARMMRSRLVTKSLDLFERVLNYLPVETLSDDVETGPRNNSSVVTLVTFNDGRRCMLTGDAGIPALERAADEYESVVGPFSTAPLTYFQAPHHGSRRNLGPTILDRLLGRKDAGFRDFQGLISSALADKKHPSPKVVNALIRRGGNVIATEGQAKCWSEGALSRPGWGPAIPLSPLSEDDD